MNDKNEIPDAGANKEGVQAENKTNGKTDGEGFKDKPDEQGESAYIVNLGTLPQGEARFHLIGGKFDNKVAVVEFWIDDPVKALGVCEWIKDRLKGHFMGIRSKNQAIKDKIVQPKSNFLQNLRGRLHGR